MLENKPSRTEWTNENANTFIIDQFKVDLWDPEVDDVEIKVFIECQMVVCEVAAFFQSAHDLSICKLPSNTCTNRYDNLREMRKRRSNDAMSREDTRAEVQRSELESVTNDLIFRRGLVKSAGDRIATSATLFFLIFLTRL